MELIGYLASALIGLSLGLVGSGGSILTIPVMVYLFHIEPDLATAYSLFVVGVTALVGGVRSSLNHTVDRKATVVFAIPSLMSVFVIRHWIMPLIPHQLATFGAFTLTRAIALMLLLAVLMLAAALGMIRDRQEPARAAATRPHPFIFLVGLGVGLITGLVGAGGGFLIIPALVFFAGLPMKKAVGSSLLIVATNSLVGFVGDLASGQIIDFPFLLLVAFIAVAGILLGGYLARFIEGQKLKKAFGWFVLVMGIYILVHETLL
ncbi:MAG: sulfite exporter TauE/SafE family protein [Ferruginibacter sp.]|nr:sulfite exporter TauE/SafE family protein [Cytophagales bacterium]